VALMHTGVGMSVGPAMAERNVATVLEKSDGAHEQVIAEVFGLYERFGDSDYIGEPVSQIEHMSQAAQWRWPKASMMKWCWRRSSTISAISVPRAPRTWAVMAWSAMSAWAPIICAGGFQRTHGAAGGVSRSGQALPDLKEPGYYERLSEASRRTLEYQGGVMTEARRRRLSGSVVRRQPAHAPLG
jgi:hypothetical protein